MTTAFWDHPRVCGEKLRCCMRWQIRRGSPPRMRGKDAKVLIMLPLRGITPAYAGKRPCTRYSQKGTRDHPRVCGEKSTGHVKPFGRTGSPPRMRGTALAALAAHLAAWITPAYAGKSWPSRRPPMALKDPPRVCGEKVRGYVKIWNEWGSPPRMRGKAVFSVFCIALYGITPAYAGKRDIRHTFTSTI